MNHFDLNTAKKYIKLDRDTGKLYWRERAEDDFAGLKRSKRSSANIWNARYKNKEAFTAVSGKGYRHGNFKGRLVLAHRMVFLLANGYLPNIVDHADGDKLNNHPSNLRAATKSQNNANRKPRVNCISRYKGVTWSNDKRKWVAKVGKSGKITHIGYFDSEKEAAKAYDAAAQQVWGKFAKGNGVV